LDERARGLRWINDDRAAARQLGGVGIASGVVAGLE
jgi:hypothetical protein